MGTHQQFCLRWNNHQSNFLSVFDDLLKHETLVDVTLACEGLSLKAHKVVLSACSPYFQHLFLDNPCKHPIVILKDIKFMDMKTLIDFMYKGEVNVSHDQLSTLLRVADTLKVKGLAEVTENMALQGTETTTSQTGGSVPQAAPPSQQQQHARPDPSINSVSPPPKRRKKSRKTSGGSNGHSDDVDSGGGNNAFGQVMTSAEMRSEVVPKNEGSEQNYDSVGLLKSCTVTESASRTGGLSRSTGSSAQQASISQESSSHAHSYTNKNSLEVPQLYESSGGEMEGDVPYRSTGLQHLSGRQDESTSSPNTQAHLPSTSSSSHADQSEYFATAADATTPSTSRTSNSQEIPVLEFVQTQMIQGFSLVCEKCNNSFISPATLIRHQKYSRCSDINELFECPACSKSFCRKDSMQRHYNSAHKTATVEDVLIFSDESFQNP